MAVQHLIKYPPLLYDLCLKVLVSHLEEIYSRGNERRENPLDKLAGSVAQDIVEAAYLSSNRSCIGAWKLLLNAKMKCTILPWDEQTVSFVLQKCQKLQQILVVSTEPAPPVLGLLSKVTAAVSCVDFDGELYFRGRRNFDLQQIKGQANARPYHWLPEAEALLKALYIWQQKLPDYPSSSATKTLTQIHLGTVRVSATEIVQILEALPNIRLLHHYQLVSALYLKHGNQWRSDKVGLPRYKLLNLDADFSHVVRCRMSPQSVLPIDALALAVTLCPAAESVRIRYDCSTHHDSIEALTLLTKLKELSVVCVTSGERCLLDFSDMAPILQVHGGSHLKYLELKVIEEVDPHEIIQSCPKLRVLTLSGCGFVTPETCPQFQCGRTHPRHFLSRLKLLFYADGDDFSWDHSLPQCFWFSTMLAGNQKCHLRGLFLESPRIQDKTLTEILGASSKTSSLTKSVSTHASSNSSSTAFFPSNSSSSTPLLPELQILSICRYSELSFQHLTALSCGGKMQYIRISQCDQFKEHQVRRLADLVSEAVVTYDLEVEEEASGGIRVGRAAK